MRKLIASSMMLALTAGGTLVATPAGSATAATASPKKVPTPFALRTNGFGSRVRGGQVPAGSSSTAWQNIGCTNNAGVVRENHEAQENLPGIGTASEIATKVWTIHKHGKVMSRSRSTIARITLADSPLGSLQINGIKSVSKTWHDARGFHAANHSRIGSITLTPAGGQPQDQGLPTPNQPIDIPGLVTIYLGSPTRSASAHSARAANDALRIVSAATGTRARVAHSFAQINDGIVHGIFAGYASGSRINAADGTVTSGRTPYAPMPCQGTAGKVRTKHLAGSNLGGQVVVGAENTAQMAKQNDRRAVGYEEGSVASVDIGGGQLHVDGIVGRVHVLRKGSRFNKVVANIKGTTIGSITANGQEQSFDPGQKTLEIPGIAKLERKVKHKVRGGLEVTALRITLLDANGQVKSVINLGQAKMAIHKSGL